MSDVHTELKNIQGLIEVWLEQLIPVMKKIQQDMPTDVKTVEKRIDEDSMKANIEFAEGMLASLRALGADTKAVEDKLHASDMDLDSVNEEMDKLVEQNPQVQELNDQLVARTMALLNKPEVSLVLIKLALNAAIQMFEMVITKLKAKPGSRKSKVNTQLENVKSALRDNLKAVIAIFRAIEDSSPTDSASLRQAVMDQLGPIIDAFKQILLETLKAFKALGGNTHLLEQRVGQVSQESPVLAMSQFELALAMNVNASTRQLAKRLQDEAEAVSNSPDFEQLAIKIVVNGMVVAMQTLVENMGGEGKKGRSLITEDVEDIEMEEPDQ